MNIADKILLEASYEGDKKMNDTAENILAEIKNRLNSGKNMTFTNYGAYTKIGELEIYLYNRNTTVAYQKLVSGVSAEFIPNFHDPKILSYKNKIQGKGKENIIESEFLYHEIIHYLDLKRSKDKNFMKKIGDKQLASKNNAHEEYYNSSAEFNTHFMQFVFSKIEKFIQQKDNLGSFDDFKSAIINADENSKSFFKNLNNINKKKVLKRLYIVYNNVQKNKNANKNYGDDVKIATKKEKWWLLKKLKNFFLNEHLILKEAKLENDLEKSKKAKNILSRLKNIIYNYSGDTDEIAYDTDVKVFYCKIDGLQFMLFDLSSPSIAAKNAKERGSEGMYNKEQNRIYFFNCEFTYDSKQNKIINFETNELALYHEIIHYLDLMNTDITKFKGKTQKLSDQQDYLNQSVELNAHWFERIMPLVEELIEGKAQSVIKQHGFDTFKKIVFAHSDISNYYQYLYPKNQKRFLKRLGEYYQKLVQNV